MSEVFHLKRGDTSPRLAKQLLDHDGAAVSLSGATVVFHMKDGDGNVVVDGGAATVTDAAAGEVRYDWQAGDTDEAGIFYGEFEVTYADASVETFPNSGYLTIAITADIA